VGVCPTRMTGTLVADGGGGNPSLSPSLACRRCFDGAPTDGGCFRTAGPDSAAVGLVVHGGGGGTAGECPGTSLITLCLFIGDAAFFNPIHKYSMFILSYTVYTHKQSSSLTTVLKIS